MPGTRASNLVSKADHFAVATVKAETVVGHVRVNFTLFRPFSNFIE